MEIKPERLKALGEAIWPEFEFTMKNGIVWFDEHDDLIGHTGRTFCPEQHGGQALIVLEWILSKVEMPPQFEMLGQEGFGYLIHRKLGDEPIRGIAPTLLEAITLAAQELIE